jgi:hypothetical protein
VMLAMVLIPSVRLVPSALRDTSAAAEKGFPAHWQLWAPMRVAMEPPPSLVTARIQWQWVQHRAIQVS